MADDVKQLQEDFKELERLASKLGKSVNFSNLKNDAEAVKELLKAWKKEVDEINREFSDLSSTFKNVIDDLRGFSSTSSNINKSFKTLGGLSDKLKYDTEDIRSEDILDPEKLEQIRGERQGWGAETANAIGGGLAKIPFTVIGNTASMLDFEDYFNTDNEVGNAVTAWAEEVKGNIEDATKIYKSNDNTLGSREWWMNNAKGLIDSGASFVISGGALGKGVQLLSKLANSIMIFIINNSFRSYHNWNNSTICFLNETISIHFTIRSISKII